MVTRAGECCARGAEAGPDVVVLGGGPGEYKLESRDFDLPQYPDPKDNLIYTLATLTVNASTTPILVPPADIMIDAPEDGLRQPTPFHIHVNEFEVLSINGRDYDAAGVQDIVAIPPAQTNGQPGEVEIMNHYLDYNGWFVFHCHILNHEDNSMMRRPSRCWGKGSNRRRRPMTVARRTAGWPWADPQADAGPRRDSPGGG